MSRRRLLKGDSGYLAFPIFATVRATLFLTSARISANPVTTCSDFAGTTTALTLLVSTMNPSLSWNSIVPPRACEWSESFRSVSFQAKRDHTSFDSVTRESMETIWKSFFSSGGGSMMGCAVVRG